MKARGTEKTNIEMVIALHESSNQVKVGTPATGGASLELADGSDTDRAFSPAFLIDTLKFDFLLVESGRRKKLELSYALHVESSPPCETG